MAYSINKFNGVELVVLEDGTVDTSTSVGLVGRNYVGYGEIQNENFVFLTENFANNIAPARPLTGQVWYDTSSSLLKVYNGTNWTVAGAATVGTVAPTSPSTGSLWLTPDGNILYTWNGTAWVKIGPEGLEGYGVTRARSVVLNATNGNVYPVIVLYVNDVPMVVYSVSTFTIDSSSALTGFSVVSAGITLSTAYSITGNIVGNSTTASRLQTPKTINGVSFDGSNNITVKSSTTNKLTVGDYLTGNDFDGSLPVTIGVNATSSNTIGTVVARNSSGGFAASVITSDLVGNVTGNVTASTGRSRFNIVEANEFVGMITASTANTATRLATPRTINGVAFDGTANITVPAAADTLTGTNLAGNVTQSNLNTVGTLVSLNVADPGVTVGASNQFKFFLDTGAVPTIRSNEVNKELNIDIADASQPGSRTDITFIPASQSLAAGGLSKPSLIPGLDIVTNLGHPSKRWNKVYADEFIGTVNYSTLSGKTTNINGGAAGSIPYQTAANTTAMLAAGTPGYYLRAGASGTLSWASISYENLNKGSYVNMINTSTLDPVLFYNSQTPITISVDATSTNTASKVVARDASGNFSAGTITASLVGEVNGNVTGNAGTATKLATARTINGVAFDGTSNITISTLYTITYGNTQYSTSGYTNIVNGWNNSYNYFDVFPPTGKTMSNLVGFIPSIAVIYYAGTVNGDDQTRCTWSNLGDRVRVWVQNTEQRSTPAANWLAIWS